MIFPDWDSSLTQPESQPLPLFQEWAVDWEQNAFAEQNGMPYLVSGDEALKIWVRCALHPENTRFAFSAHSTAYGNELKRWIGESFLPGILESQLRREIQETLLVCPYILTVDQFSFFREGSTVTVRFTVHTIYEQFEEEVRIS